MASDLTWIKISTGFKNKEVAALWAAREEATRRFEDALALALVASKTIPKSETIVFSYKWERISVGFGDGKRATKGMVV